MEENYKYTIDNIDDFITKSDVTNLLVELDLDCHEKIILPYSLTIDWFKFQQEYQGSAVSEDEDRKRENNTLKDSSFRGSWIGSAVYYLRYDALEIAPSLTYMDFDVEGKNKNYTSTKLAVDFSGKLRDEKNWDAEISGLLTGESVIYRSLSGVPLVLRLTASIGLDFMWDSLFFGINYRYSQQDSERSNLIRKSNTFTLTGTGRF